MPASSSPVHRLSTLASLPTMDHLFAALEIARNQLDVTVQQPWVFNDTDPYSLGVVCSSTGNAPEWTLLKGFGHAAETIWVHQTGDAGLVANLLASEFSGGIEHIEHSQNTYASLSHLGFGEGGDDATDAAGGGLAGLANTGAPSQAGSAAVSAGRGASHWGVPGDSSVGTAPAAPQLVAQVFTADDAPPPEPVVRAQPQPVEPEPAVEADSAQQNQGGMAGFAAMKAPGATPQAVSNTGQSLFNPSQSQSGQQQAPASNEAPAQPFRPTNPYAQQLELAQNSPEAEPQNAFLPQPSFPPTRGLGSPPQPTNPTGQRGFGTGFGAPPPQPAPKPANPFGHITQNQPALQPRPAAPAAAPEAAGEHRFASPPAAQAPAAPAPNHFASLTSGDAQAAFGRTAPPQDSSSPYGSFVPPPAGATGGDPFSAAHDPFAHAHDPFAQKHNPFEQSQRAAATAAPQSNLDADESAVKAVSGSAEFSGDLKDTGAPGLLQAMATSGSTGRLEISSDSLSSQVYFEAGEPVHAATLDIVGDPAILEFMTWKHGSYTFKSGEKTPQRSVRSSSEKLINDGITLAERYQQLLAAGLKAESCMSRKSNDLTETEFEKAIDKTFNLNLNQQKWFYHQIDSKSSLLDILRRHSMPRAQWVPILLSLVNSNLISLRGASEQDAAGGEQLESTSIDKNLIETASDVMREPITGLMTYPMFLYFLDQEYARFERNALPFALVVFELAIAKDGQVFPLMDEAILGALTARWRQIVRPFDVVAHYGETQFVMLLPYTSPAEAVTVTSRIVESLPEVEVDGVVLFASGVASVPSDCKDPEHLLTACAEALKVSKLKDTKVVSYQSLYV